jgi:hypothetical protein
MKVPEKAAAKDRSRYADKVPSSRMGGCEHALVVAAEAANRSRDVRAIELEFGKLETEILEPWDAAAVTSQILSRG